MGTDKWAHLGIGGLACALITIALILAEHQVSPWRMLLFPLGGAVCVFIFSFFKEMIDNTGFCWKDITIEEADKIKKEQEAAMAKE